MFEAFAQADGTTAREYGGTGLGPLDQPRAGAAARRRDHADERSSSGAARSPSICRRPRWSTPTAPADPAQPIVALERAPRPPSAGLSRPQGARHRRRLPQHLRAQDRCWSAADSRSSRPRAARRAWTILARTPDIDVVLVDIMMPVMDGYATIRAMRALAGGDALPIVGADRERRGRREPALHRRRRVGVRLQAGRHRRAADAARRPT